MKIEEIETEAYLAQKMVDEKLKNLKDGETVNIFMERDKRSISLDIIWGKEIKATLNLPDTKNSYDSGKLKFEDSAGLISDVLAFINIGIVNTKLFKEIKSV